VILGGVEIFSGNSSKFLLGQESVFKPSNLRHLQLGRQADEELQ
jgi:hypothetical protein